MKRLLLAGIGALALAGCGSQAPAIATNAADTPQPLTTSSPAYVDTSPVSTGSGSARPESTADASSTTSTPAATPTPDATPADTSGDTQQSDAPVMR